MVPPRRRGPKPRWSDETLREAIRAVLAAAPFLGEGHRKVCARLRWQGVRTSKGRVLRLMREDNLLCVTKRKFVVTTDSAHGLKVYPNLAASMILTGVDQLWIADITYIRLAEELKRNEKERAEHVMLVDLGRNDVGRVCEYGSVRVPQFMGLERFSHVMHLTSIVEGRLADNRDRLDALVSCFPAGTVSGAPKVRAMEIIKELEPSGRGLYAGAVGYLDFAGNLDFCIAIRTVIMSGGKARVQAGAGIVSDSNPAAEYEETRDKARALVRALELAQAGL